MGLDQYLYKKTYVQNWDHHKPADRHEIIIKLGGEVRTDIKPERICYIEEKVCQWRKANQIHKWFVDNVQNGNDDCGTHPVEADKLRRLVETCKEVLGCMEMLDGEVETGKTYYPTGQVVTHTIDGQVAANPAVAKRLLPSQEGFFFGSTDYDQYYADDLKHTIETLEAVLAEGEGEGEFYYRSSW